MIWPSSGVAGPLAAGGASAAAAAESAAIACEATPASNGPRPSAMIVRRRVVPISVIPSALMFLCPASFCRRLIDEKSWH